MVHGGRGLVPRPGLYSRDLCSRAVVKSTFVESKTSPRPGLSSPSQDRVQRGSSPSQVQVQEVRVQVKSKSK